MANLFFASDLYALGLTAIYMLTGKTPQELATNSITGDILWQQEALNVSPSLANVLDQAIKPQAQQRFATAQAMKAALIGQPSILPTQPVFSAAPTQVSPPPSPPFPSGLKLAITMTIVGLILGSGGMALYLQQQNKFKGRTAELKTNQPTESVSPSPSVNPNSESRQPEIEQQQKQQKQKELEYPKNTTSFYFIQSFAYKSTNEAQKKVQSLKSAGYSGAGYFWIPDYPNLSGKAFYTVYPAKFSNRHDCASFLQHYSLQNSEAYCVYASQNFSDSSDRFYAK